MKRQLWNEGWRFRKAGSEQWQEVMLPHDAMFHEKRSSNAPSADAGAFFENGMYVYEKVSDTDAGHAVLSFDGVYKDAKIYLNDELLKEHAYGYSPFLVTLGALSKGDVVRVECGVEKAPDSRWYSGAGIYRDVTLYTSISDEGIMPGSVRVTTLDYSTGRIRVETGMEGASIGILDGDRVVATGSGSDAEITVPDARSWSEEDPYLYTIKVVCAGDYDEQKFGIRQIEKRADGLYLNGKNILLRGGCVHHDNGLLGGATYRKSEYRRVKILKEAGFNAIRSSHNPASEAMLEACDELGMYVMDETWDMWFNHKSRYDYASKWQENHMEDIDDIVRRDFNHPSVIMYSIGNEVSEPASERGLEAVREMTEYLRKVDPNRLVTGGFNLMIITNSAKGKGIYDAEEGGRKDDGEKMGAMNSTMFNMIVSLVGSGMNKAANSSKSDLVCSPSLNLLDVAGYNYASGRYRKDAKLHPDRIIIGSETMPYDIAKNWKMVEELPTLAGDFMWTAWDYIGENGIGAWGYTKDAKGFAKPYPWWLADTGAFDITGVPNAEADWAKATWHMTEKPLIDVQPLGQGMKPIKAAWRGTNGIASYSWKGCDGEKAVVEVFYDAASIELWQNGKRIGKKKVRDNRAKFSVYYHPGTLEAVAFDHAGKEIGRNSLVSAKDDISISILPEEEEVRKGDIVYVPVVLADVDGTVESNSDISLEVEVSGGTLLAFGSARPRTEEDPKTGKYTTYFGRALAIVRADREGVLTVKAGNSSAEIRVL